MSMEKYRSIGMGVYLVQVLQVLLVGVIGCADISRSGAVNGPSDGDRIQIEQVDGLISESEAGAGATGSGQPDDNGSMAEALCDQIDTTDDIHFRVIYPNGGELFRVGDTVDIQVCSEDPDLHLLGEAAVELSVDGGINWLAVTGTVSPDESIITHVIPPTYLGYDENNNEISVDAVSDNCRIRINSYVAPQDYDISDGSFRIVPRDLSLGVR
jgi:hypothetical protein